MESHHVAAGPRGFGRWGSAQFRRPPGHRKHGGWHMFPEDSIHGYMPSRSVDQLMEDETGRRSTFRVDGKYNRIYRDNGVSFAQRDWKGANSWEDGNGRLVDACNNQRSVDGLPHTSCRHMYPDEAAHGYMRSSSADKLVDEENGRRSTFRGDGKYARNYRENRGSFGQRDWKGPNSWENSSGRPVDVSSGQRSIDGLAHASCRHMFSEDSSHSYMPSRSTEKLMEEDGGRGSTFRENEKYNRNYRDTKGYFGQRVWKDADTWESNSGRPLDFSNNQRSVDELTHASSRHFLAEESAHGYVPLRSVDKLMEEESARRSSFRGDGKYNRSYRDNRGSFRQRYGKDTKSSENSSGRPIDVGDSQRTDDELAHTSCPQSDCGNACDSHKVDSKEHDDVSNDADLLSTGQKCEKDNSLAMMDWKPLKWSRSESLSSRGSGLSHSSSSKSMVVMNSCEVKDGTVAKDVTPVTSPTGDAVTCVTSAAPAEEINSMKKPRLGWGEGLAKYEKKKVEGLDEVASKLSELDHFISGTCLASKSPIATGISDCASPVTPSSIACSSSPGIGDKSFQKNSSGHSEPSNMCQSPGPGTHDLFGGFSFYLENMDPSSIANLGLSLVEMLQSDDPYSVESGFMRSPALRKLFLWRSDVVRALEVTEFEIDSLENELKSLVNFSRGDEEHPKLSSSLAEAQEVPCEPTGNPYKVSRPAPLEIDNTDEGALPQNDGRVKQAHSFCKDGDVDSPGTATLKYNELAFLSCSFSADVFQQPMDLDDVDTAANSGERMRRSDDLVTTGEEVAEPSAIKCDVTFPEAIGVECLPSEGKDVGQLKDISMIAEDNMVSEFIIATNKETVRRASEVFDKVLPDGGCKDNISSSTTLQIDPLILRKFAMRKRFSRFKERAVALKYKAFGLLWKEDLHHLALRKCRAKSQKKCDSSQRVSLNGYQMHRSSIRLYLASLGNWSLASTTEPVSETSKLLADSPIKIYRKNLTMPALTLDDREKIASRFVTTNGLIEDPCALEKERKMINPWTTEERKIFLDKLATFGKDFRKIASFLDHKTTADCVEFYYKNHKSDCFERTKSKLDSAKRGELLSTKTYLKTSEKRWSHEVNSISLELLGAASVIASQADDKMLEQELCVVPFVSDGCNNSRFSRINCGVDTSGFGACASEREVVAADVLAGIGCSLSSEAMSSCVTSSVDPGEKGNTRMEFVVKSPLSPDLAENAEEVTCSGESCGEVDPSDWTDEEKSAFIQALSACGKDFQIVSQIVGTRSSDQCKIFFSKARKCLGLDLLHPKTSIAGTSFSNDANGGDSDLEDACGLETSSAVCDDQSGSKGDEDLGFPVADATVVESAKFKSVKLQPDLNKTDMDAGMQQLDAGMQQLDAVDGKDTNVIVADDRMLKNCQSLSTLPGLHKSAVPFSYADGLGNLMTTGVAFRQKPATMKGNLERGVVNSAHVDYRSTPQGFHEVIKNSLPGEESVLMSDTPMAVQSSMTVGSRKGSRLMNSSCIAPGTTPALGRGVISEPRLRVSFGTPPVEVLTSSSFLWERSREIAVSASQESNAIPVTVDRASSTAADLPVGRLLMSNEDHSKIVSGNPPLRSYERMHALRGLPVHMLGQDHGANVSAVPNFFKAEDSVRHQYILQDDMFRKCDTTRPDFSMAELPLLTQKSNQPNNVPSVPGQSSLDEQNSEKPSGSGDIKLFGQILSHPTSTLKSQSIEENGVVHQKVGSKPSIMKPCGNRGEDRSLSLQKFDSSNSMNLQNVPLRSYGFWDGNRIQTVLPSLPDSAILLDKYPTAFSTYPMSSAKLEQLQLQTLAKSSEHHMNGLSTFAPREVANTVGIMDYLSLRSREECKAVKQPRLEACSDAPRCDGFETIPILQQHQGMGGMITMNAVGRGGVVISGPCNGISDPVAAIKKHYAQSEQYVGQNVNMNVVREDESWSSGDLRR